jgi:L-threonylcarbamoyladenylate synthase
LEHHRERLLLVVGDLNRIIQSKNYDLSLAAQALRFGNLVAFPTETVYGLGADATNKLAISKIYKAKGRPLGHPVIVHISSKDRMFLWARNVPDYAVELANNFWPGPLSLILSKTNLAKNFITGGQDSVGLRVPNHFLTLSLLSKFEELGGMGVAAPSANKFGAVSPTNAEAVLDELGDFLKPTDLVLDGGQCSVGLESTIIDCTGLKPIILRPGAITEEMVNTLLGSESIDKFINSKIKTPGLLKSHYAPKAKVVLNSETRTGDGYLALSSFPTPAGAIRLASPETLEQYARQLYVALRMADQKGIERVSVKAPEGSGLAKAILDRLTRASNG